MPTNDDLHAGVNKSRALFSRDDDGNEVDAWIWDELLGDDAPDPSDPYHHDLSQPLNLGGAGSGNFGHSGRPGEVGGSAPAGEGGGEAKEEGPAAKRFREENEARNQAIAAAQARFSEAEDRIKELPQDDPERQALVRANQARGREIMDLLQKRSSATMFGPDKDFPPPPPRPHPPPVDMDTLTPTETKLLGSEEKGINGSYRVKADGPNGEHVQLQYKPDSQQQRIPFPGMDYKDGWPTDREIAAYKVDQVLGYDLITDTQRVKGYEHGPGSAHLWAEGTQAAMQGHVAWDAVPAKSWYQMGALDIMIGNRDRHVGNFLISDEGLLTAVDHGYSFHKDPENSLIIESSARQPVDRKIPASERKAMADKIRSTDWNAVLGKHLRYPTVDAFKERAAKVADAIEQGKLGDMWSQVDPRSHTSARESPRGSADSRGSSSGGPSSGVPWGAD